ncbi:thermonuclease family protein [Parvibaculum sp.]|uniref:thermonuclease family protein n=1 Tax=Parvibaculum sp. TaxID=2024848 RepID=UPI00320C4B57
MRGRILAPVLASLVLFGSTSIVRAKDEIRGPVEAQVIRVVDGDTLKVKAEIWLGQTVEVEVRLAGVDAPELKGKCREEREGAIRARDYLARLSAAGHVRLTDIKRDKFGGRVIANVSNDETPDFSAALRARGLARAYGGAKRGSWC